MQQIIYVCIVVRPLWRGSGNIHGFVLDGKSHRQRWAVSGLRITTPAFRTCNLTCGKWSLLTDKARQPDTLLEQLSSWRCWRWNWTSSTVQQIRKCPLFNEERHSQCPRHDGVLQNTFEDFNLPPRLRTTNPESMVEVKLQLNGYEITELSFIVKKGSLINLGRVLSCTSL